MNDNKPEQRSVFAVPVTMVVRGTLFLLTTSAVKAAEIANSENLEQFVHFDHESLSTDDSRILVFDKLAIPPLEVTVVDLRPLSVTQYAPNTHPDFVGVPHK